MTSPRPQSIIVGRFRQLPQRSNDVWQGGVFRMPLWIDDPHDPLGFPFRPLAAFWRSVRTGLVHIEMQGEGDVDRASLAVQGLWEFGRRHQRELGGRPARIEVTDADLAASLEAALTAADTPIDTVEDLPEVIEALRDLEAHAQRGRRMPGLLEGQGVTPGRVRAFAEAAADFYRAAPWRHFTGDDLIAVEAPGVPPDMRWCAVMGNSGQEFGLSFFATRAEFERIIDSGGDVDDMAGVATHANGVTFGPLHHLPFGDVDAWERHGWPVAAPVAYPLACDLHLSGSVRRPDGATLTCLEAILRGFTDLRDEELDSGRWSRPVTSFDGHVRVDFSLPQVLEYDAGAPRRRPAPHMMARAAERAHAQVGRFLETREFASIEEVNEALQNAREGGLFDAPPEVVAGRPLTPLEEAQELAYDAMEASGRVRLMLARRALARSQDCADAWVLLGEAAPTPEESLELFQRGVEAGERVVGADAVASPSGQFWQDVGTRPYMRARFARAQALLDLGQDADAVKEFYELLRLNPNDNQGVRHVLMPLLLEAGDDERAGRLLEDFGEDLFALWPYARALWTFRREGDSTAARTALTHALRVNPHVAGFLLKPETIPAEAPPTYSLGSEEEAASVADQLLDAWASTEGAVPWLRRRGGGAAPSRRPRRHRPRARRR